MWKHWVAFYLLFQWGANAIDDSTAHHDFFVSAFCSCFAFALLLFGFALLFGSATDIGFGFAEEGHGAFTFGFRLAVTAFFGESRTARRLFQHELHLTVYRQTASLGVTVKYPRISTSIFGVHDVF